MQRPLDFVVSSESKGMRLDQAIAHHLDRISRTKARALLATGGVFVDGRRTKVASRLVREGQRIRVHQAFGGETPKAAVSPSVPIPVVYESDSVVVVNKPSGVFSAPTPSSDRDDLMHFLSEQLADGASQPLHLVHRLDRPTSGLMVVAKGKAAAAELSRQVAAHEMGRLYLAILVGTLLEETRVNAPLSDQVAITTFRPQEQRGPCCLVEAALSTGRTHQVRRHAESLLAPVAGDSKYGRLIQRRVGLRPPRLALHASSLCFVDPLTKQPLSFAAALPPDLSTWWDGLKAPA